MTATAADFLNLEGMPDIELLDDLKALVWHKYNNTPRHLQLAVGPSEVGHPCARRLALGLMQAPKVNKSSDPLPSIFGTAMHTWLEDAARQWNDHIGYERFIPERRVRARDGLEGSCDLYDVDTKSVLDWKCPGTTAMRDVKKNGVSQQYRVQRQTYGRGYANLGYDVQHVGNVFLPRAGQLAGAYLDREPYDPTVTEDLFKRLDDTTVLIHDLDVEHHPEHFALFPTTADHCEWCPYWSPNPTSPTQCGGG